VIKNLPMAEVVNLAALVDYQPGQVVSRTLNQGDGASLTLFAFSAGEGLSAHATPADALLYVLDGQADVTIDGKPSVVRAGEAIVLPATIPHAVDARENFKMLLMVTP